VQKNVHVFHTTTLDVLSISFTSSSYLPLEKEAPYPLNKRLGVGPMTILDTCSEIVVL